MAEYGQIYYRVLNETTGSYESSLNNNVESDSTVSTITFFDSLSDGYEKIGIQAPPGTKFSINGKAMIMGRSGVYELESTGIQITSLIFYKDKIYKYLEDETSDKRARAELLSKVAQAYYQEYVANKTNLTDYYNAWQLYYSGDPKTYYSIDGTGLISFSETGTVENQYLGQAEAEEVYLQSIWGVYGDTGVYKDLENIIVDFVQGKEENVND